MSNDPIETLIRASGRRPAIDSERAERVRRAAHEAWTDTVARRRRNRFVAAIAAAASIGGITLFVTLPREITPAPIVATIESSAQPIRAGESIETPAGGRLSLDWGGATLRLDETTRITLHSTTEAELERGAVYFSSERNATGVAIETPFGTVRDIGTQFEVRLERESARIGVREGRVEMRGATAGRGTSLVATAEGVRAEPAEAMRWEWVQRAAPPFRLEGMTLDAVLRRVAREKGLSVDWKTPPGTGNTVLRGREPLTIEEALEAAPLAAGVQTRIEGDRLVVEMAPQ